MNMCVVYSRFAFEDFRKIEKEPNKFDTCCLITFQIIFTFTQTNFEIMFSTVIVETWLSATRKSNK